MKLKLYFENEVSFEADFDLENTASLVMEQVLTQEKCPFDCEVNLVLTDSETVKETNRIYRGIDKETDVLSFPNVEFERPGDFELFQDKEENCDYFDPDTGLFILGDIMISSNRVVQQAQEYGHEIRREYAFLIAHSMLHLIGYDHMNETDASCMEEKQKKYLDEIHITR